MPSLKNKKKQPSYSKQNNVTLLRGGKPYFDKLLQMIDAAQETIHLQTYIFGHDETGTLIAEALKKAVARKVEVYLLADGYASKSLPNSFIYDLEGAGVHFRYFNPLFKTMYLYFGRRLHHKIVVVDAFYSLVGGVNIADRYNDMPGIPAWLDFALYTEGEASVELCKICRQIWYNSPPTKQKNQCIPQPHNGATSPETLTEVAVRRNDWVRRQNQISATYIEMCRTAQSHITILCSYFLPGRAIRKQLKLASKRGIQISVITAGISDVPLSKYAERFMYDWLLRNNIALYEYETKVLHGKLAVCDSKWMTLGSYNINDISAYASLELNLNIRNSTLPKETNDFLQKIAAEECIHITPEHQQKTRTILRRLAWWFSFILIRVIFYLFTFYYRRRR